MRAPANAPAAPLRTSLVQRISAFASVRQADPEPPLPHDDLTRIRGIGPRLAERLNLLGVARFDQIAALSAVDVRRLSVILGLGRIISARNWIGQAALLRGEASVVSPAQAESREADGVFDPPAPAPGAVATIMEREEPQPSSVKARRVAGGLLEAIDRKVAIAPSTRRDTKLDFEDEIEPECVTEQAAMPHSPETLSDFLVEKSLDHRPVVGDGPPPLPQETLTDGFERTDEPEDAEHGLRMIAALTTMPSLEPDCAEIMMEEIDIMTEEADITIIERASVQFDEEDDAGERGALGVGDSLQARSYDDKAPKTNASTRAGYYDDVDEAIVEIIDVDEGDEGDDLLSPQDGAPTRRKFFRALTGDGS
jgi:predicted flap endonuclease-1-like 5' DNA nuclease